MYTLSANVFFCLINNMTRNFTIILRKIYIGKVQNTFDKHPVYIYSNTDIGQMYVDRSKEVELG